MRSFLKSVPWRRLFLIAVGFLLTYFLVPVILSRYNETKSLREARLARAIKFGDYNTDFNSKANGLSTLMGFFAHHNQRMKDANLKDAKTELFKNYKDRYLADINATVWWWPQDFGREVATLDLLSASDRVQLDTLVTDYNTSLLATTNALRPLWIFMDSSDYKANDKSLKKIETMIAAMDTEMGHQSAIRNELVQKISGLFANSNYRTRWRDAVVFW
jgi:hypothetical protein